MNGSIHRVRAYLKIPRRTAGKRAVERRNKWETDDLEKKSGSDFQGFYEKFKREREREKRFAC